MDSEEDLPHFNVDVNPRFTGFTPERDIDESRVKDADCKLLTALNRLQSTGTFASSGVLPFLDPQIYLQDVGTIPLPMNRTQGRQLISKARPATYDMDNEMTVDASMRNTWELKPDQFEIRNSAWGVYVESCCARVAQDLGIKAPIAATLHKMLIYDTNAMSKRHTDGAKSSGTFGTLLIVLPSPHKGGAVSVKHRRDKKSLPILGGTQSVDPSMPCPSFGIVQGPEVGILRDALEEWLQATQKSAAVYYTLDHEYPENKVTLEALKNNDMSRVQALKQLASELDMDIFLAILEKETEGTCSTDRYFGSKKVYPLDEARDIYYKIRDLVELDGRQVACGVFIGEEEILSKDRFNHIEPKDQDVLSYQTGRGSKLLHRYEIAAVALMPKDFVASFVMLPDMPSSMIYSDNIGYIIDFLARSSVQPPGRQSSFNTLKTVCRMAWARNWEHRGEESREVLDNVFKAALHWKDHEFFEHAAGERGWHPSPQFFQWARERVATGDVPFNCFKRGFLNAVMAIPIRKTRLQSIVRLVRPTEPISDEVRSWLHMIYHAVSSTTIGSSQKLSQQNGYELADLIEEYGDFDYLATHFASLVESKLQEFPFILGFMAGLFQYTIAGGLPEESSDMYARLAERFIGALDISALESNGPAYAGVMRQPPYFASEYTQNPKLSVHDLLVDLIEGLMFIEPSNILLKALSLKIKAGCPNIDSSQFHSLWLPFLHALASHIEELSPETVASMRPEMRRIITTILSAYIDIYVGRQPVQETSLVRQPVRCDCHDCERLNDFLGDPTRRVFDLTVDRQREGHLARKLQNNRIDCKIAASFMGPSYTVIFAKTFENNRAKRDDWFFRKGRAKGHVADFGLGSLTLRSGDAIVGSEVLRETGANQRRPSSGLGPGAGIKREAQDDAMSPGGSRTRAHPFPSGPGSSPGTHIKEEVEPSSGSALGMHIKEEVETDVMD
ncbi:2OG-Fe(II) oxygenase superfamily protein [Aspergillus terreus]|uniref:2OG-Fe(II) oxygenase superfamily protein n=1 Tax=Aspergillus terreus TaxID=33178 RepID=A0A5M3YQZ5_ASPTE|nr:hypothetical protein ATETN484_0001084400 [Aspergillus terreus]GFF12699.1 2OG-Fe(II) oxygenase superfamily protein [Aspergillus terreus]